MATKQWSDGIYVVELPPRPGLMEELVSCRQQFERDPRHVVIDFAQVDAVTSSHISQLLRIRQSAIELDRKLVLCAVPEKVMFTFTITGLDKVFNIVDDIATVLAGLQID